MRQFLKLQLAVPRENMKLTSIEVLITLSLENTAFQCHLMWPSILDFPKILFNFLKKYILCTLYALMNSPISSSDCSGIRWYKIIHLCMQYNKIYFQCLQLTVTKCTNICLKIGLAIDMIHQVPGLHSHLTYVLPIFLLWEYFKTEVYAN